MADKSWIIKIISGLHSGAECEFSKSLSLGSSEACDVVLHDHGVAEKLLQIQVVDGGFHINNIHTQSKIYIDGVGQTTAEVTVKNFQTISVTTLSFALGPSNAEWTPIDVISMMEEKQKAMQADVEKKTAELEASNKQVKHLAQENSKISKDLEKATASFAKLSNEGDPTDANEQGEEDKATTTQSSEMLDLEEEKYKQKGRQMQRRDSFATSVILLIFVALVASVILELTLDRNIFSLFSSSQEQQQSAQKELEQIVQHGDALVTRVRDIAQRHNIRAKILLVPASDGRGSSVIIQGHTEMELDKSAFIEELERTKITADVSLNVVGVIKSGIQSLIRDSIPDHASVIVQNVPGNSGSFILEGNTKHPKLWEETLNRIKNDLPAVIRLVDNVQVAPGETLKDLIAKAAEQNKSLLYEEEKKVAVEKSNRSKKQAQVSLFTAGHGPEEKAGNPEQHFPIEISRIILGSLHFFVTKQGKRYKEGDVIENGYKVLTIVGGKVIFEKGKEKAIYILDRVGKKRVSFIRDT